MSNSNTDGRVLSSYFEVYINNVEIDFTRKRCITSIQITEQEAGSDEMSLSISDPDLLYIKDDIYKKDNPIRVILGWKEDTYNSEFVGYISAVDIEFSTSGASITVNCIDRISHLMNKTKKTRSWDNVTTVDVIEKIAKEYGLKVVKQSGYSFQKQDNLSQSDQTDIEFLEGLCDNEAEPFMCKIIENTVYYIKKAQLSTPVYEAHYGEYPFDVVSFSPQINIEEKKEEEKAANVDNNKEKDSASAKSNNSSEVKISSENSNTSMVVKEYNPQNRQWVTVDKNANKK